MLSKGMKVFSCQCAHVVMYFLDRLVGKHSELATVQVGDNECTATFCVMVFLVPAGSIQASRLSTAALASGREMQFTSPRPEAPKAAWQRAARAFTPRSGGSRRAQRRDESEQ